MAHSPEPYKSMTTRVKAETYNQILQRCIDNNCTTYQYLRNLVEDDIKNNLGDGSESEQVPQQTELIENERDDSGKIRIIG